MQKNDTARPIPKYCVLELTLLKAMVTDPMPLHELNEFVKRKYGEQPLNYFNNTHSLWVIDIVNRTIRPLSIKLEL